MVSTRDFKETVKARADRREALLTEAVEHLTTGKVDVGKARAARLHQRHDRIRAARKGNRHAVEELDADAWAQRKSRANNLPAMIGKLQRVSGARLAVGTGAKKRAA
jgi:aspartate aminotransferase-like enzyme